jgi:endonuclease/exonuclease/phosphatase family metal-dependent hydrolase
MVAWIAAQQADVVSLNECNGLTRQQLMGLARRWGHAHVVFARARSSYHVALTSRLPMAEQEVDSAHFAHGLVRAQVGGVWFLATHLTPNDPAARQREASLLRLPDGAPGVLLGDLNSLSPHDAAAYEASHLGHIARAGPTSARDKLLRKKFVVGGQLDYRVMEGLYAAGWRDLVDGFEPSVPTRLSQKLDHMNAEHAIRLDYVLGWGPVGAVPGAHCGPVREEATHRLSDHYPLRCTIRVEHGGSAHQN